MVNPYTFVPLGDGPPVKAEPTWHDKLREDCISGSFLVDITVRTPILLGKVVEGDSPPRRIGESEPAATIVPGSTLAGSIRSVHEALTNSCLRVLDLDYVPVHRQFMSAGATSGLRLALVIAADDEGLPTRVQLLATDPMRIEANAFPSVSGRAKSTDDPGADVAFSGMRLSIDSRAITSAQKRARARDEARRQELLAAGQQPDFRRSPVGVERCDLPAQEALHENRDGEWVLYVSDTKARPVTTTPAATIIEPVWYRAARIPSKPVELPVSEDVRRCLARAIEGAADMHRFATAAGDFLNVFRPKDAQSAVNDTHHGPVIGRRRRVHTGMFATPGVPVWVALSGSDRDPDAQRSVREIRLAQAWRIIGDGEMTRRAGTWAPCREPEDLCPSCAVFGSAGADEPDASRGARQSSYRGHVRIEDAAYDETRAAGVETSGGTYSRPTESDVFTRRPLGSPKPTAGQFYLQSGPFAGKTDRRQPLAQWGSPADGPRADDGRLKSPRQLAGRKFYWATTSAVPPRDGRGASRDQGDADEMVDEVRLILPESGFTARVTVDNLTRSQIGSLLAAIDTQLLGDGWSATIGRLGGGRPFGWGAVTMRVDPTSLTLHGPSRYTSDAAELPVTIEALISEFLSAHPDIATPSNASPISHLRRVLTLDAVADAAVAYPTGAGGDPFDFWKWSAGVSVQGANRPLGQPPLPLNSRRATS